MVLRGKIHHDSTISYVLRFKLIQNHFVVDTITEMQHILFYFCTYESRVSNAVPSVTNKVNITNTKVIATITRTATDAATIDIMTVAPISNTNNVRDNTKNIFKKYLFLLWAHFFNYSKICIGVFFAIIIIIIFFYIFAYFRVRI